MSLSKDTLNEMFSYKDGNLYWKYTHKNGVQEGALAGSKRGKYKIVSLNKKNYLLHRIIYIMHYGHIPSRLQVDHIDINKENNKIENLRLVTKQENAFNRNDQKGYYYVSSRGNYRSRIIVDNKTISLGSYLLEEDARSAYLEAKEKYHIIKGDTIWMNNNNK